MYHVRHQEVPHHSLPRRWEWSGGEVQPNDARPVAGSPSWEDEVGGSLEGGRTRLQCHTAWQHWLFATLFDVRPRQQAAHRRATGRRGVVLWWLGPVTSASAAWRVCESSDTAEQPRRAAKDASWSPRTRTSTCRRGARVSPQAHRMPHCCGPWETRSTARKHLRPRPCPTAAPRAATKKKTFVLWHYGARAVLERERTRTRAIGRAQPTDSLSNLAEQFRFVAMLLISGGDVTLWLVCVWH